MSSNKTSVVSGMAQKRLMEERKNWRKDHPYGFWARPTTDSTGTANIMKWEAGIPGKEGTLWEGGEYRLELHFPDDYPIKAPKVMFKPPLFHPNVFDNGLICLSILNEHQNWKPSLTLKQILLGVQDLLDNPNPKSPAQHAAHELYVKNRSAYNAKIKQIAEMNKPQTVIS